MYANKAGGVKRSRPASASKECVNPIFERWICEWKDEAIANNSKLQFVYGRALSSLRKYPLPLSSGRECHILEYFGPGLCQQIDKRLAKEPHLVAQSQGTSDLAALLELSIPPMQKPKKSRIAANATNNGCGNSEPISTSPKKKSTGRSYVPAYRSGAYALLITLLQKEKSINYRGYMLKSELQQESQEHCDASMTSNTKATYTSWSSMSGLVTKGLVIKQGTPVKYIMSIEGRELARKLFNAFAQNLAPQENPESEPLIDEMEVEIACSQRVDFRAHEFEVLLCVDTSETTAKSRKDEVIGELQKNGVQVEIMRLSVGDFVWICRKIQTSSDFRRRLTVSRSSDLILPYVVERKRSDDLASSIRDGRFQDQKSRLEQTGLQPIYLIESYGSGDWGLADGALEQAIANTQITNCFVIQETESLKDTCAYLTHMTRHLARKFQGKPILSCTKEEWPTFKSNQELTYLMRFSDFNEFGAKSRNWTVSQMFARHLMKIRGLSNEKAFAIVQVYPTVSHLMRAYRSCATESEAVLLLVSIRYGSNGRSVGKAISSAIHSLYNSNALR